MNPVHAERALPSKASCGDSDFLMTISVSTPPMACSKLLGRERDGTSLQPIGTDELCMKEIRQ